MNITPTTTAITQHALGEVSDDWAAIDVWLEHLRVRPVSRTTLSSYRYQIEKLRWYCEILVNPSPSVWTVQEAGRFVSWLQTDAHLHISARGMPRTDPTWTPFKSVPSKNSIGTTLKVVNEMFKFWVEAGYIVRSPMMGLGRGSRQKKRTVRAVRPEFMEAVLTNMELQTDTASKNQFLIMVRNRFVLVLLERTGLRANEVVMADMDDIDSVADNQNGAIYWRLNVRHSKGGKETAVPLDNVVLDMLKVYRQAFGLPAMPVGKEPGVGLVLSLRTQPLKTRHGEVRLKAQTMREFKSWASIRRRQTLWEIVKTEFEKTALALRKSGYEEQADALSVASTHWLRHTFATRLVEDGHNLRVVAQLMRHESIRSTMIYTNQDFLDLARQIQPKKTKGDLQ